MRLLSGVGGAALITLLGVALAGCSEGDKTSDGPCARGARCGPGMTNNPATGAGNGAAAGSPGSGAAGNFGNTAAKPPDLTGVDAGEPDVGETTDSDNPLCGGLEVEPEIMTEVIPGNVLFIFDKSGSMCDSWGTSADAKWIDAQKAVTAAIEPLQDNLKAGAIFFPDTPSAPDGDSCYVPPFNAAPQIEFTDGPAFLAAWSAYWTVASTETNSQGRLVTCENGSRGPPNAVNGSTPLLSALQVADAALAGAGLTNTTNVVIITDGQPNCSGGTSNRNEPLENLTPTIETWLSGGYKTYVVGLPGVSEAVPLLDGLAVAGGTTQHIPANDPAALQMNLAMIIGMSVTSSFTTCEIGLPQKPPDPNKVNVVVVEGGTEQAVASDLGTGGGWMLAGDQTSITLHGPLCDHAKLGHYEKISVVFGCVDLPPLPPPKPPE